MQQAETDFRVRLSPDQSESENISIVDGCPQTHDCKLALVQLEALRAPGHATCGS